MPGAQPGRPTLRRHETEEELLYYQDLQAISGDTLDNIGVYLSYRHKEEEDSGRRCLLPAVTGEASTTRCRVAPAQTNPRRREGNPRR